MAVRGSLIDFTDAGKTAAQIVAHDGLFRLGFLADLIMVICDVIVSLLFYLLLRKVNPILALFATTFRLIQSAILGSNLLNLFSPLLLLQNYVGIGDIPATTAENVLQSMFAFEYGYLISGVFFAINCLLMGSLIRKSSFLPKFWGYAMTLAGFSYLINCLSNFLFPQFAEMSQLLVLVFAVFAELGLCIFLLAKGMKKTGDAKILASQNAF